ncbi:MAG: hydroxymethylpyrimidine/phosphomethylpyrimidine kinase [Bacteroidota bacterium]
MPKERPCVLSIAGFDPSGGAGILADIKTFEQHKVLGMGVVTGLTFQNDSEFDGVKWIEINEITKQMDVPTRKFKFEFIKIGMIQNLEMLEKIIAGCRLPVAGCKIIWDPIVKASAGFQIHKSFEKEKLISILKNIFLITPNTDEIKILTGENDEMKGAKEVSKHCNVFLKGGHSSEKKGRDYLFTTDGKVFPYKAKKISTVGKHGSGCVLSSAITANLANGNDIQRSCLKGKDYVTKFLMSNKTLVGYHICGH